MVGARAPNLDPLAVHANWVAALQDWLDETSAREQALHLLRATTARQLNSRLSTDDFGLLSFLSARLAEPTGHTFHSESIR